jgi:hypothetical protein
MESLTIVETESVSILFLDFSAPSFPRKRGPVPTPVLPANVLRRADDACPERDAFQHISVAGKMGRRFRGDDKRFELISVV